MSGQLPTNLNPNEYSVVELYRMFKLTPETTNESSLKEAKRKVLALHPDKAGPQYNQHFIFYMAALNRIIEHFAIFNHEEECRRKMNAAREQPFQYTTSSSHSQGNYEHAVNELGKSGDFNDQFNSAYEKTVKRTVDHSQYQWFGQDTPTYNTAKTVSAANMGRELDQVRKQQQNQQVAVFRGVRELNGGSSGAFGLYDDDETVRGSTYVSSDPFSKLKYDDLRKVHKDETVFSVSEENYSSMPTYRNVEEYAAKARPNSYQNAPLTQQQQEELRYKAEYERQKAARIKELERQAYEDAARYGDMNNQFMSNLLRLR